jgi:hypothetical protein
MFTELINKKCPKCNELKAITLFSKNKTNKDGYAYECKGCHAERIKDLRQREPEKFKERAKKWRENNPSYVAGWQKRNKKRTKDTKRKEYLKSQYGITPDQYNEMRVLQNYCCVTCGKHEDDCPNAGATALNVDHCHTSGAIRKLLCMSCNIALGKVEDSIVILENLIQYLKDHNETKNIHNHRI